MDYSAQGEVGLQNVFITKHLIYLINLFNLREVQYF